MKNVVSYESLIASAIFYFKKIDKYDIKLLIKDLNEIKIKINGNNTKNIDIILNSNSEQITLKDNYNLDTIIKGVIENKSVKDILLKNQNELIENYFNKLNIDDFVFRKIQLMKEINRDYVINNFNEKEKESINNLINKGYIAFNLNENLIITQEGKLNYLINNNNHKYNKFIKECIEEDINLNDVYNYLINSKLDSEEIFDSKKITKHNENNINSESNENVNKLKFKDNNIFYYIKCEKGDSKLIRPENLKPCNKQFVINNSEIFAIKKYDNKYSYYELCPYCGYIVKIPEEYISNNEKMNINQRYKDSNYDELCKLSINKSIK